MITVRRRAFGCCAFVCWGLSVLDVPSAAALLCAGGCLILDVPSAATLGIGVLEFMTRLFSPNLEKGVIISQLPNSEVFTPYPAFCLYKNTVVL